MLVAVMRRLHNMNPGDVRLVHTIETDDPKGIESYWKRKFEERKVPGKEEIFRLNAEDVAAFKSRHYQ